MDKIDSLKLFCRITELGSYSEVAREQHMSRSGVSRIAAQLEQQFGIQLFKRTTRSLTLTDAGKELYIEAERLIRQFDAMEDRISRNRSEVKGLLRIGVPGPLNERFILPDIPIFYEKFPDITLFFQVSESLSDLYKDELDIIIRMGPMHDSSLMTVKLTNFSLCLSASPAYLTANPISHPNDLKNHNCLCFHGRGRGTSWILKKGKEKVSIPVTGNFAANCGYSLRNMAVNDQGITAMPRPLQKRELESGELIQILPDWEIDIPQDPWSIHLLYHPDRHQLNRVRAFIDFIKDPNRLINTCDVVNSAKPAS